MGKNRIGIVIKANHLNLITSFKSHLEEEHKYDYNYSDYDDYDDYDNDYGLGYHSHYHRRYNYDYYKELADAYDNYSGKKYQKRKGYESEGYRSKRVKYEKKKDKARKDNKYYLKDDNIYDDKLIYFYKDYLNPEVYEKFENLCEFDAFLNDEGIDISDKEVNNILTRGISYCCANPKSRLEDGTLELISKSSYGDLRYECSELEYDVYEPNTAYAE